ncbi:hypothetical protein SLEP1_g58753 [Rubroshorea leprosula]|uniref:Uncharacterized protein n=1 Tax=Rubroshorea leprosula TaxID=152421 RepID=A0AAV5MUH5_9ROSI|nr:hypothetical protein SLEP1_g58753 [Rubroshorea leprosula]
MNPLVLSHNYTSLLFFFSFLLNSRSDAFFLRIPFHYAFLKSVVDLIFKPGKYFTPQIKRVAIKSFFCRVYDSKTRNSDHFIQTLKVWDRTIVLKGPVHFAFFKLLLILRVFEGGREASFIYIPIRVFFHFDH